MSLQILPIGGSFSGSYCDTMPVIDYAFDSMSLENIGLASTIGALPLTRSTVGRRYGANGRIESIGVNVARFQYNPSTLAVEGLLLEGGTTNDWLWSEDLTNAAYTKDACTIGANAITAPDGTLTADKIIPDATNAGHQVKQTFNVTAGKRYTVSKFVKDGEYKVLRLQVNGAGAPANCYTTYDFQTGGDVYEVGAGALRGFARAVSDGFVRMEASFVAAATSTITAEIAVLNNARAAVFAGDGTSGAYAWGGMREVDMNYATSYIPTTTVAVARASDLSTLNVSSVLTGTIGMLAEYKTTHEADTTQFGWIAMVDDNTANNRVGLAIATGTAGVAAFTRRTGTIVSATPVPTTNNAFNRAMGVFKATQFSFNAKGSITQAVPYTKPTVTILRLNGQNSPGAYPSQGNLNGVIKRLSLYALAAPDSTLAAKTA